MPDSPNRAVFLSYASQDAVAARGIADALRAAGLEVWFDQNELAGGDAWDAKIRGQIKECALFVPMISAATQARAEGYFRREWKLAVERTQDMADHIAFLVPVVLDATTDREAHVPDKFRDVQWTRLAGGEPTPQFVERVKRLLAPPTTVETPRARPTASTASTASTANAAPAANPRLPAWAWATLAAVIVVGAFFLTRKSEPPVAPALTASKGQPAAETKAATPAPVPAPALPPLAPEKSIAVLPFENLSPDKDNAFFADGVHEDVITSLTKIRDLKVIARTSVLSYRDPATRNHKQIAADLGVATLLEGSVRRVGTKVRVSAQLLNARTDETLWAETYDLDLTDVFTIQSALAQNITAALKANFTTGERALVADRPTQNLEAYDDYLRARALFERGAVRGLKALPTMESAIALYEQAVAKDPSFASAYAQLAYLNGRMYWYGYLDPTAARLDRARAARDAALRLAPGRLETRLAQGAYLYYCDNDWAGALKEFYAGSLLAPSDAQLLYLIALCHRRMGNHQEAAPYFARSMALNPHDAVCAGEQLTTLRMLRRFGEVRDLAARYQERFPSVDSFPSDLNEARLELGESVTGYLADIERGKYYDSPDENWSPYFVAVLRNDLNAAERVLANPGLTVVGSIGNVVKDPADLERARIAFLLGKRDAARKYAEQAIAYYQTHTWTKRQADVVMLGTALAHALAGHEPEAVKLAREGFALQVAHDRFLESDANTILGSVYLVLGRRDDAFGVLRNLMTAPGKYSPQGLRLDPMWKSVKDDPRFEEILKLAKPL